MPKTTTTKTTKAGNPKTPKGGKGPGTGKPGNKPAPIVPAFVQPAFDPRIQRLSDPFGSTSSNIARGFMWWDGSVPWSAPFGNGGTGGQTFDKAPKVFFLYNPSTIAATYAIDNVGQQSALIYPAASVSTNLIVPLQQTVSFTIMFDRTYEVNTDHGTSPNNPNAIQRLGCELDVLAMKQFTGMFSSVVASTGSATAQNPFGGTSTNTNITNPNTTTPAQAAQGKITQGVMTVALSWIYFAGTPKLGLKFYGYVSGWDVQYTHFSQQMIPMRAVIDVSYTLLPPPTAKAQSAADAAATRVVAAATGVIQGVGAALRGIVL